MRRSFENVSIDCIISWIILGIILFIFAPMNGYGIRQFWEMRDKIPIKIRYARLTMMTVIYFFLYTIIHSLFCLIQCGIPYNNILYSLNNYIFPPLLLIGSGLLTLRLRLVHNRINIIFDLSTLSWKNILTKNVDDPENKINNDNGIRRFERKQFKFFMIYVLICTVLDIIIVYWFEKYNIRYSYIACSIFLIPLGFNILYMKCGFVSSHVRDIYYIKWEETYIIILVTIALIINVVFGLILYNTYNNIIYEIFAIGGKDLSLLLVSIIMTNGLLYKIKSISYEKRFENNPNGYNIDHSKHAFKDFVFLQSNNGLNGNKQSNKQQTGIQMSHLLKVILNDKDGIHIYCEHQFVEFTIENVLSLIEFIQWLQMYDDNVQKNPYNFELSNEIPKSYINSLNINEFSWFDKITSFYDKYIKEYAEYQINIPYNIRVKFENSIQTYQNDVILSPQLSGNFEDTTTHNIMKANISDTDNDDINTDNELKITDGFHFTGYDSQIETSIEQKTSTVELQPIKENIPTENATKASSARDIVSKVTDIKVTLDNESHSSPVPKKVAISAFEYNQTSLPSPLNPFSVNMTLNKKESESLLPYNNDEIGNISPTRSRKNTHTRIRSPTLSMKRSGTGIKDLVNKLFNAITHSNNVHSRQSDINVMKLIRVTEPNKIINKETFIDIINETINILVQLNYQSLERFVKTDQFKRWYQINSYLLSNDNKTGRAVSFLRRLSSKA